MPKISQILSIKSSSDYALLDSGEGEKLERFGTIVLSRPDPQAVWAKKLSSAEWKNADGYFSRDESPTPLFAGSELPTTPRLRGTSRRTGGWKLKSSVPAKWEVAFGGLKFWIKPTAFKHTGLFPEQEVNWGWLRNIIGAWEDKVSQDTPSASADAASGSPSPSLSPKRPSKSLSSHAPIEVLNLFGYTGGATLACAQAGAKVVHIDSSKAAVAWARENAEISGLKDAPIRWIIEDARLFVEREIKRGRKYHGIIMDPPAFGHGPTSELWRIEEHFLPLVEDCKKLLADRSLFFLINGYSAGYSAVAYENMLLDLKDKFGGEIEVGELTIEEGGITKREEKETQAGRKEKGENKPQARLLPAGIFARWFAK